MPGLHGFSVVEPDVVDEFRYISNGHQACADGQRKVIDPHRELQIAGANLVDHDRRLNDAASVPDHTSAENDGNHTIEDLYPASQLNRQYPQH